MKCILLISQLAFSAFLLTACASPSDSSPSPSATPAPSPTPSPSPTPGAPTASEAAPLVLKVSTIYDETQTEYPLTFQETSTTTCTTSTTTPSVTCTVAVPEARLYFSSMKFSYSWRNDKCKLMIFQPYYYIADNTSGAFIPHWNSSPVKCTDTPLPAACYGGAAPYIVPDFGKYFGLIYFSDPTDSTPVQGSKTLPSAYSKNYGSNRLASSDLPSAKQGNTYNSVALGSGDSYVASTFVDYTWTCRNDWYDPVNYQITLIVTDQDSAPTDPQINHFDTWKEAP